MFIQRVTSIVRPGCMDDAVAMVKAEIEYGQADARVLTAVFGPFDRMIFEVRFPALADFEPFWAKWSELPTTPKFQQDWPMVSVPGGSTELWEVREPGAHTGKIVNRRTFMAKSWQMDAAVQLLQSIHHLADFEILTPSFGPNDIFNMDLEFADLQEYQAAWEKFSTSSEAGPFYEKWFQVVDPGGANEIWEVR